MADEAMFWDHFDEVLRHKAPAVFGALRPPASDLDIAAAEEELELTFPEDLRQAYRRHDGGQEYRLLRHGTVRSNGLLFDFYWCPLQELRETWRTSVAYLADNRCMNQEWLDDLVDLDLKETDVLPDMWDPHRIPVARDLTSSRLSIDMKPGGAGVVGQLIQERMDFHAYVMAPSIGAYFGRLAELLDSGVVVHDPQKGFLQAGSQNTTLFRMFPAVEWFDWTVGNG